MASTNTSHRHLKHLSQGVRKSQSLRKGIQRTTLPSKLTLQVRTTVPLLDENLTLLVPINTKAGAAVDKASMYVPVKHSSPHFTGRTEYIDALVTFFYPRSDDELPARREFLLYGIGGVGKTQVCLKFAEQHSTMWVFLLGSFFLCRC